MALRTRDDPNGIDSTRATKAERARLFTRFRWTAFPTALLTTKPNLGGFEVVS